MKKRLLVVGVAATLGALSGVSAAAIWGPNMTHSTTVGRRNDPWSDGGKGRSRSRYRGSNHASPGDRVMTRAKERRNSNGGKNGNE